MINVLKELKMKKTMKLFGREFAYTHFFDKTVRYTIGGVFITDKGRFDMQVYWHKLCFGIYIKKDHWL